MLRFMNWRKIGILAQRVWHFLWEEDSAWSWIANIVIAFLIIRFIFYPVLGLALGTSYPIVAVVSESMEHGLHQGVLCGDSYRNWKDSFNNYWDACGGWYEERSIAKEQFRDFPFPDGFDKGDVIILWRAKEKNTKVGDILVFRGNRPQPVIHRIVKVTEEATEENEPRYYQTKGDHNRNSIEGDLGETRIDEERIIGKGVLRVPYLGWIKILFVEAVRPLGINIQR